MTQVEHGDLDSGVAGPERGWPPAAVSVSAARVGDRAALGSILAEGLPRLVGFYRGMGLSRAEAEDIASEACEGMIRGISKLRDPAAFEAWFWSIARNRFRTALRKRGKKLFELAYVPVDGPEHVAVNMEEHAQIRAAFGELSVRDRELLWLREVEGLSYDDIGRRIASRPGTVRVATLRARRRLDEAYRKLEADG